MPSLFAESFAWLGGVLQGRSPGITSAIERWHFCLSCACTRPHFAWVWCMRAVIFCLACSLGIRGCSVVVSNEVLIPGWACCAVVCGVVWCGWSTAAGRVGFHGCAEAKVSLIWVGVPWFCVAAQPKQSDLLNAARAAEAQPSKHKLVCYQQTLRDTSWASRECGYQSVCWLRRHSCSCSCAAQTCRAAEVHGHGGWKGPGALLYNRAICAKAAACWLWRIVSLVLGHRILLLAPFLVDCMGQH